jgi:epoxyqueuosine reductase
MGYLAEHAAARARVDGDEILAGARTVVCLARRYDRDDAADPGLSPLVARYARGRDYHGFLKKKLRQLAKFVRGLAEGTQARALCDTAPVLERAWAARAGLGFIGKNGMLIVPGQGSYCLLGEVITTLPVDSYGTPMAERCGDCTACLDACPTDAFDAPFVLDPRRCVSYATIESRSLPDPSLWSAMGEHLFGCDVCQQVCPYNKLTPPPAERTEPFAPSERWSSLTLSQWVTLDEAAWRDVTRGSPVFRATRIGMAHNALMVAKRQSARDVIQAALDHDDKSVRDLAQQLLDEP